MAVLESVAVPQFEVSGPSEGAAVVALGGISATRHVTSTSADATPGWWEAIAGVGRAIDTRRLRVIGMDYVDGGAGADGRPESVVTTADQADALAQLLDTLGVDRLHALVGASYGGMVALAFAERFPERVSRLVVISAAHESDPMTTAVRAVQRRIVELGLDAGRSSASLAIARELAMTTYRSRREFAARFGGAPPAVSGGSATFPVEGYLRHHGERFAATWVPARFLALSLSADLHRVDPAAIRTPTLLIAAEDDAIVPRAQVEHLAAALAAPARIADIRTITGHDAFLTEPAQVSALLQAALDHPEFP